MPKSKNSFLFLLFFYFLIIPAYAEDIAIVVGADYNVYKQALEGFKAKINHSAKEYGMQNDIEEGKKIAREIKKENPKLIFCIGNKATQVIKSEIENIPIVYALVINPSQYGLSGENICGVSWEPAPLNEFEILKQIAPHLKKIGVIYNPESYQNLINEAQNSASGMGLQLVTKQVRSLSEVNKALEELLPQIEAFWMTPDPLVANSDVFKKLVFDTLFKGVILYCPAENFVKDGAVFSLSVRFKDSGAQAAGIANKILEGKATCKDIGTERPDGLDLFINKKIIDKLGVSVPESLMSKTTKIY